MKTGINILIDSKEPFADGVEFLNTGPYEKLSGRINFTIDPNVPLNMAVVDLEHALRNPSGFVEYSADFYILKPVDLSKGNQRLIYDVVNRGNKRILQFFNDAEHSNEPLKVEHAGNGFLMRRGYTLVWSGWQGDILQGNGRMTMRLPIASVNDREINGVVRAEFIADKPGVQSFPLSGNDYTLNYETNSLDTSLATFTYREYEDEDRKAIDHDDWHKSPFVHVPSPLLGIIHIQKLDATPVPLRPSFPFEQTHTRSQASILMLITLFLGKKSGTAYAAEQRYRAG